MYQAQKDAKGGQLPAVFHRKNHSEWLVTMKLEDWITLYDEYYFSKKLEERNENI